MRVRNPLAAEDSELVTSDNGVILVQEVSSPKLTVREEWRRRRGMVSRFPRGRPIDRGDRGVRDGSRGWVVLDLPGDKKSAP